MFQLGGSFIYDWGVGPPSPFWFVRNGGNDANGGGFDPGYGGTNYADQDSPQITLVGTGSLPDDHVYSSSGTPAVALAAGDAGIPATPSHLVGNYLNVVSGTNTVPGIYKIVGYLGNAFSEQIYQLDRFANTAGNQSTSDLVAYIGGAFATLTEATTQQTAFGGTIINELTGGGLSAYYAAYYQRVVAQEVGA